MFLRVLLSSICYTLLTAFTAAQQPGSWQDHLPYHQANWVSSLPDKIICATPYALFTVDVKDNTIERRSKVNGLSDVGIAAMKADEQSGKTVIAYSNGNIDLLASTGITNLDQVKRSNVSPDKTFHDIFLHKNKAWIAASFGIVLIDLLKNEIRETYIIGRDGRQIPVYQVAADSRYIYAATEEGLLRADAERVNLSDFRNWQLIAGGSVNRIFQQVVTVSNSIIARKGDSLFVHENNNWRLIYAAADTIRWIRSSQAKMLVAETSTAGASRVSVIDSDGFISTTYLRPGVVKSPTDAIIKDNDVWIADGISGLLQFTGNNFKSYQPNSPFSIASGAMIYTDKGIWVTSGVPDRNFVNSFSKNGFFRYSNMTWTNYTPAVLPALDSLYDLVSVAVNSKDNAVWFGSLGGGLLRFREQEPVQVFKQLSGLSPSVFHPGQYKVAGLAFDGEDHLWISNYGATESLVVKKSDGTWRKFGPPFSLNNNALAQVLIDDYNQKWILSPGNGLVVFNHGLTIDNSGDDRWRLLKAGRGNGNLPDNSVLSIAQDKSGFIWVGTERGIGIIQCASAAFTPSCEALLPVVQQDNFAGYLFSQEAVQDIAVNGADQKWIATRNGVWLISADGARTIHHFTSENTPLFSNDVRRITIDPTSGDVFFATAKGICAFRGNAIEGGAVNELIRIYPNPVPPGYNGSIAIRGLVNNAIVKITELDGRLVYQTRALGGQAIWNGRDYRGRQISSGVYLVVISDDSRQEKTSGKIVFISR